MSTQGNQFSLQNSAMAGKSTGNSSKHDSGGTDSTNRKRPRNEPPVVQQKKRGPKPGCKRSESRTKEDWFRICQTYSELPVGPKQKIMSQKAFLASKLTPDTFSGTPSELSSFARYLKLYKNGDLTPTRQIRARARPLKPLETALVEYLQSCESKQSWEMIRQKALEFASSLGFYDFKASTGWISKTLHRYDLQHVVRNAKPPPLYSQVKEHLDDLNRYCFTHRVSDAARSHLDKLKTALKEDYLRRSKEDPRFEDEFRLVT